MIHHLSSGPLYKQSTKKADKELEFIPVNLHLQRMTVINEDKNTSKNFLSLKLYMNSLVCTLLSYTTAHKG